MAAEIVVIVLALVVAVLLARQYPDATRTWFERIRTARTVVFGIVGLIVALMFIGTGSPGLMLFGFLALVYGSLWVLYEDPHETIREVLS